ncbi:hypothetical protein FHR83_006734 [Actinoplanes campanulatus]|uniref:Uncharacterized protein n=1 Tax=Actinoplanes campanulatus TaxID=113559 RepID=A0A7W5AMI6_9ACTN|nr:hypothetical protein [Actinoplanes campanulatus]MBB3099028.1 hypothetical protein [Actinoplanes campanulatus]GGN39364.1 hypothetical protein GCM10010109_67220 [Actinoplanes campanulatus]GID40187.1 hypothetical protein Aca09nite_66930 [Actinoplanes campanulatus]
MTTHFACIATAPDVVADNVCDLSIGTATITGYRLDDAGNETAEYAMSDNIIFTADLTVLVNDEDKLAKAANEADEMLTKNAWTRTAAWDIVDNAMYAEVEPA